MSSKKNIYIIAAAALFLIIAAIYFLFIFNMRPGGPKGYETSGEVKEVSEIPVEKRPYVTLTPTSDGAEIIISIENMAEFDRIEYELTYLADNPQISGEKIQRGATGVDINTKDAKYKKSILLGTASKGVRSPDRAIADGKLTMHSFKGETEYLSETKWDLMEVGTEPATLSAFGGDITIRVPKFDKNYWVIIADTVGLPRSADFDYKNAILPSFGIFSIAPKFIRSADLMIKLSGEVSKPALYAWDASAKWQKIDAKFDDSQKVIGAHVESFATFVPVSSQ